MDDVGRFDPSRECNILTDTGEVCPRHGHSHHEDTAMTDPKTVTVQERLRNDDDLATRDEAADLLDRCKEALEPFAKAGELFPGPPPDFDQCIYNPAAGEEYALGGNDLRRAREVLTQLNGGRK